MIAVVERKAALYYIASLHFSPSTANSRIGGREEKKKAFRHFFVVLFSREIIVSMPTLPKFVQEGNPVL